MSSLNSATLLFRVLPKNINSEYGIFNKLVATSTVSNSDPFLGPLGTASMPTYSFIAAPSTGVYSDTHQNLNFSVQGNLLLQVLPNGIVSAESIQLPSSTVANYGFVEAGTGLYNMNADLNLAVKYDDVLRLTQSNVKLTLPNYFTEWQQTSGGVFDQQLGFNNTAVTNNFNQYYDGNSYIFSVNGANVLTLTQSGISYIGNANVSTNVLYPSGNVNFPSIAFLAANGTGVYLTTGNNLGFAVQRTNALIVQQGGVSVPAGNAAAPGLNFIGDAADGFWNDGNGNIISTLNLGLGLGHSLEWGNTYLLANLSALSVPRLNVVADGNLIAQFGNITRIQSGIGYNVKTVTATTYTVQETDYLILMNPTANANVILPLTTALPTQAFQIINKSSTYMLSLLTTTPDVFDDSSNLIPFSNFNDRATLLNDGAGTWYTI